MIVLLLSACSSPPRIVVDPLFQDLGELPQVSMELVYKISNVGGKQLIIEKISTSCGCTYAEIDKNNLAPGESTSLRVTLDPIEDNLYGDLTRVIYLRSNDPQTPEAEVEFRVIILKPEENTP